VDRLAAGLPAEAWGACWNRVEEVEAVNTTTGIIRAREPIRARRQSLEESRSLDVSVVLPVYNEGGHLDREIRRIRRSLADSPYSFEMVVVDDGSTDGSDIELVSRADVRVIRLAHNRGAGAARRIGTEAAAGRVVVWSDADMSYPNDRIAELVSSLEGYDQVVGARTSEKGSQRVLRVPAKWFIRKLASYLLRTPIPDLNSGFRAFRREVGLEFMRLIPDGFSCVTTLTMAFIANGYAVRHVPITYAKRAGSSKFRPWTDTKRYLTQVVRMVVGYEPLRLFVPAALALAVFAIVGLLLNGIAGVGFGVDPLITGLAALNVLMLGFVADAVVRLNRPEIRVRSAAVTDTAANGEPAASQWARSSA
jgi:glycosyltransferase involved in cell wall biosynthesis